MFATILQDLRYSLRTLGRSPGFTAVAVLTLALGIGATTAIFGVLNEHLLDPVPRENEGRLVEINETDLRNARRGGVTPFLVRELRRQRDTFEALAVSQSDALELVGGEFLEGVWGCRVSADFFDFFGARPSLGGRPAWEESASAGAALSGTERAGAERAGASTAAEDALVISHAWWQSRFGGDPRVVGKRLRARDGAAGEVTYTVVGVMPPEFGFPSRETRYWRPLRFTEWELSRPMGANYTTFARLAPGASAARAQAALDALGARLARDFPADTEGRVVRARPLREFLVAPDVRRTLWGAAAAAGFVLLIVCANLANLQLARGEGRLREMSVRSALGASRARLVRQLLTESVALSLAGGAAGLLVAVWLRQVLERLVPPFAPALRPGGLDGAALAWTFGAAAACGTAFGLYPALRAAGGGPAGALKGAAHSVSAGPGGRRLGAGLVVAQVALALVLLCGAGLLVRSVVRLLRTDPGLDPRGLAVVRPGVRSDAATTPGAQAALTREVAERLAALPGTAAVGVSSGRGSSFHYLPGNPSPFDLAVVLVGTGPTDFFRAVGARLKEGRWLDTSDAHEGADAAVVNETLAALTWPGQSALGRRFYDVGPAQQSAGPRRTYEVVGVVRNFSETDAAREQRPTCFVPLAADREPLGTSYYVRTALDPASLAAGVRRVGKEVLPGGHAPDVEWVERELYASTATRRLLTGLLAALAAAGLLLSLLGVFGVLHHAVTRRTKEIGVRMALGASGRHVLASVLARGLALVAAGVLAGTAGAAGLTRLLGGLLFGVGPTDPLVFAAVPLLLLCAAVPACWLPARRAARVGPAVALRHD